MKLETDCPFHRCLDVATRECLCPNTQSGGSDAFSTSLDMQKEELIIDTATSEP